MDFLKEMKEKARLRASLIRDVSLKQALPIISFKDALLSSGISIIAEIKYATPAEGALGLKEDPSTLAQHYQGLGASAISCLTEPEYFLGDIEYIPQIKNSCTLPVLIKDFIVDTRQIALGRSKGADAFLLITEMLEPDELETLYAFGKSLKMNALVEVHSYEGLEMAINLGAEIIGINSRDLKTLKVIPGRHEQMIKDIPKKMVKVAESGISSNKRLLELASLGYDAALIGRAMVNASTRQDMFSCG
jgi:indole-3-glycerol phosphate synthase